MFVTGGWLLLVQQLPPDIPFHLSVKAYIANTDCGFPVLPTYHVVLLLAGVSSFVLSCAFL